MQNGDAYEGSFKDGRVEDRQLQVRQWGLLGTWKWGKVKAGRRCWMLPGIQGADGGQPLQPSLGGVRPAAREWGLDDDA